MRCALVVLLLVAAFRAVSAAPPDDLALAASILDARLAVIASPATPLEAKELKALALARGSLATYAGGADKVGLKALANLVKGIANAASPDPEVASVLGLVRAHLDWLAAAARADAGVRVPLLAVEKARQSLAAGIAKADAGLAAAQTAWLTSPSKGTAGHAKAIAAYQKVAAAADKSIAKEATARREVLTTVRYPGLSTALGLVTFPEDGAMVTTNAYPGEVQIHLRAPLPAATARALMASLGGTVIAQSPDIAFYVVRVEPGQEGAFIAAAAASPAVYLAIPHLPGLYGALTAVAVVDNCDGTHGEDVKSVLTSRGVPVAACLQDGFARPVWPDTVYQTEQEIKRNKTKPTLANISSYTGFEDGKLWEEVTDEVSRQRLRRDATYNLKSLLKGISELPAEYRENLVITLCAGNNHVPIDGLISAIEADPKLREVLRTNILIVGSKGQDFSNYASDSKEDFVWVSNPESARGTSFAAPYALALISKMMDRWGLSATEALWLAKRTAADNLDHELVEAEVLPEEAGETYVGFIGGLTTDTVDGSVWETEVSLWLGVVLSGKGTVGDPYDVQFYFAGTVTDTLLHCADEFGCEPGGTYPVSGIGQGASTGKVTVTALLGGESDLFTVWLTDGTLSGDGMSLVGMVTVESFAFDTAVSKVVTLDLEP